MKREIRMFEDQNFPFTWKFERIFWLIEDLQNETLLKDLGIINDIGINDKLEIQDKSQRLKRFWDKRILSLTLMFLRKICIYYIDFEIKMIFQLEEMITS